MANKKVNYGSDVSAGRFQCADCGKEISIPSRTSIPPCPNFKTQIDKHTKKYWIVLSGRGDAKEDPYPYSKK